MSGAVAGAFLGIGALILQLGLSRDLIPWSCGVVGSAGCLAPPVGVGGAGLVLGGLLGRRVPGMSRGVKTAIGSMFGAVIGAALGGTLFLFIEVMGEDWPSGLAAFVTGSLVGGAAGAVVGGLVAGRSSART